MLVPQKTVGDAGRHCDGVGCDRVHAEDNHQQIERPVVHEGVEASNDAETQDLAYSMLLA